MSVITRQKRVLLVILRIACDFHKYLIIMQKQTLILYPDVSHFNAEDGSTCPVADKSLHTFMMDVNFIAILGF